MSGPKRNPDRLNTIGVVVVGICAAVLVYVSIVALQAFYMNDSSEVQTMADYGGNDTTAKSVRTEQVHHITEYGSNPVDPKSNKPATFRIPIDVAMKQVVNEAKVDPANLVPTQGRSDKATVQPVFGRPKLIAPPAAPAPAGDGAGSAAGSGSPASAPTTPTGGAGQGSGVGQGSAHP